MRILLVNNQYESAGGEKIFDNESKMLTSHGHFVERMVFDNPTAKTWIHKLAESLKSIYNPGAANAMQIKIDNFKPEIIHVHNFVATVSPAVIAVANKNHIPVVMTLHNYGVLQKARLALEAAWHNLAGAWGNKVDRYIALTQFAKEKFKDSSLSIPEGKMMVKPNSVPDRGRGLRQREDYFLFAGALTEDTGVKFLLRAAALHNFKIRIIGEGPLKSWVETAAKINGNIEYMGSMDEGRLVEDMKKCRALIFPSVSNYTFPTIILEAFSTGTVVLAPRLDGISEIIEDQKNGILFEPGNVRELVSGIIEISTQPERMKRISDNARLAYIENYTQGKNYHVLTGIYDQVLAQKAEGKVVSFPALAHADFFLL